MVFLDAKDKINVDLKFALPGKERQDSVYSGLQVREKDSNSVEIDALTIAVLSVPQLSNCLE